MSEIPIEAKNLIEEFKAQQRAEQQRKSQEKQHCQSQAIDNWSKKPMRAKEVQKIARSFGLLVEDGRGRHGIHLVASNGKECPLPIHGGGKTLATGTQRSIAAFINQNRVTSIRG